MRLGSRVLTFAILADVPSHTSGAAINKDGPVPRDRSPGPVDERLHLLQRNLAVFIGISRVTSFSPGRRRRPIAR
jgi:hypothetical protein